MTLKFKFVDFPVTHDDGGCTIEIAPAEGSPMPEAITLRAPSETLRRSLRVYLDRGEGPLQLEPARAPAPVLGVQTRALAAGLQVAPDLVESLSPFDRCLLSLLTLAGDKPMSSGRLAYLVSDLFDEISVNRVRERLAEIRKHFERHGVFGLLLGDGQSGYWLRA